MSLLNELKRRNVFKVGAAYLALGWIVTQVTTTVGPALNLPATLTPIVVWVGVIGLPFVLMFSWAYELTPEGLKRERDVDRSSSITHVTSRRLDYLIIAMLGVAMLMFAADRFMPRDSVGAGSSGGAGFARDSSASAAADPAVAAGHARDTPNAEGAGLARDPAATLPPPDQKSIAVLPFVNLSSDPEQEYFSDGLSEELLNLLAKIPTLQVTSRSSAFSYKGKEIKLAEVARELNVAHILEGSVRKSGSRIRITAQLIDARTDKHLWSETYDRTLEDIFTVQDEIAGAVVGQLKIQLLGEAPKAKAVNPEAYALFLQARQLMRQSSREGIERAIETYQKALTLDPSYAAAWTGLAGAYSTQAGWGLVPFDEGFERARTAVTRALAIDPDYALAHASLGRLALAQHFDFATAAKHFEHALALEPGNDLILAGAASLAYNLGRLDTAIALSELVAAADPVNPGGHVGLGGVLVTANRIDEGIAHMRTALALSPERISGHYAIGLALLSKGEPAAALEEMRQEPDSGFRLIGLAIIYHDLGKAAESDAALEELIRLHEKDSAYNIAYVLAYRGEADRSFEWLEKSLAYHDTGLSLIAVQPHFAPIHSDPRWLPFLRKIGMAPEQLAAIRFEVNLPARES